MTMTMKTILKHTILGASLIAASVAIAAPSTNPLAGTNKPKTPSADEAKLGAYADRQLDATTTLRHGECEHKRATQ